MTVKVKEKGAPLPRVVADGSLSGERAARLPTFRVQVNATDPKGWFEVAAENREKAAADAAWRAGVGDHVVYVALGNAVHANGAPMVVQSYRTEVRATARA